ncbi:peptide MFS transporter [Ornithinibacillus scapharcae]|uniref:peptide MFS transporter n=1 Tax=Ornithinibacillus scapharcae TaxID=1147159 RepID=UPI000225ADB7|nr:peptide MFS transporter [Ornithinibacillus scapharcae]
MDATLELPQGKKHPKGLYLLFFTELWERYSYFGMRAILVLYLTTELVSGGLGVDKQTAMMIYGIFTGFVYFTPIIGGYLADRFIGVRSAITIGGITIALGNFVLFLMQSQTGLYLGLALLIIGNGFFKPNMSTLVGDLYHKNDKRKDAAFTIFYMGINIGALFAPLIVGYLASHLFYSIDPSGVEHFGYQWAFLSSSIGMVIGQILFNSLGNKYLRHVGKAPTRKESNVNEESKPLTKKEKQRTKAVLILACFVVFFWAGFEQAGSSFTLYTKEFVDREVFGFTIPVSWFQSLNPLFIILLAPIISALWMKLSRTKRGDLNITTKMALGMILLGLGFMILLPAVIQTGSDELNVAVKANVLFIVLTYLFHTLGELFLSPVGLSLVSKVAPVKIASLLMGLWMAATGVANIIAGQLASLTASLGYLEIFAVIGGLAIILGLVLLSVSKKLTAMMQMDDDLVGKEEAQNN